MLLEQSPATKSVRGTVYRGIDCKHDNAEQNFFISFETLGKPLILNLYHAAEASGE